MLLLEIGLGLGLESDSRLKLFIGIRLLCE